MNTTDGWCTRATAKRARTIFSPAVQSVTNSENDSQVCLLSLPSPTHLDVSDEALMEKKVDFDCEAMHFPATNPKQLVMNTVYGINYTVSPFRNYNLIIITYKRFACSRGSEEKDAFGRGPQPAENVRPQ